MIALPPPLPSRIRSAASRNVIPRAKTRSGNFADRQNNEAGGWIAEENRRLLEWRHAFTKRQGWLFFEFDDCPINHSGCQA